METLLFIAFVTAFVGLVFSTIIFFKLVFDKKKSSSIRFIG